MDLCGRLLLTIAGTEEEVGADASPLPASSYCLTRSPPILRLTLNSWEEGEGERLGEASDALRLAPLDRVGGAGISREAETAAAASAACLPACLIFLISAFVGRMIYPLLVLGRAGQLSWHAS